MMKKRTLLSLIFTFSPITADYCFYNTNILHKIIILGQNLNFKLCNYVNF
jgi:hypothetical protein